MTPATTEVWNLRQPDPGSCLFAPHGFDGIHEGPSRESAGGGIVDHELTGSDEEKICPTTRN